MMEIDHKNALDVEQAKRELMGWFREHTDPIIFRRLAVDFAEKLDDVLPRLWATAEETGRQQVRDDSYSYGIGR